MKSMILKNVEKHTTLYTTDYHSVTKKIQVYYALSKSVEALPLKKIQRRASSQSTER